MKKMALVMVFIISIMTLSTALASEQKLVNGAGTLKHKTVAFSFDLGLDLPEPFLYGLRFDFGVSNRVQLGAAITVLGFVNTFGINSMFNILKTDKDSDFLSLYVCPFVIYITPLSFEDGDGTGNIFAFFLKPGIAYEHRFGEKRNLGVYLKTGTAHFIGATHDGKLYGQGITTDTAAIDISPGIHGMFGKIFSMGAEFSLYIPFKDRKNAKRVGYGGMLSFTWALN